MKTLTLLTAALACAIHAQGAVLYDNFGPGDTFSPGSDAISSGPGHVGYTELAVPFTSPVSATLNRVTVAMGYGAGNNLVRLTLRPDAGGVPDDTILDILEVGGFPADQGGIAVAASTQHPVLEAGAVYWVVAETVADGDVIRWHLAGTATGGRAFRNAGSTQWGADGETTYALRVEGAPPLDLESIIALVEDSSLPRQRKRPLLATLKGARAAVEAGNCQAAIQQLKVFQKKIIAQLTQHDAALADALVTASQAIIEQGCSD